MVVHSIVSGACFVFLHLRTISGICIMGRHRKDKEVTTNAARCRTYREKNRTRYRKNDANSIQRSMLKLTDPKTNALRLQEDRLSKQLWRLETKTRSKFLTMQS